MNKGFTLIELLVVVLIIGILAAVALPQYTKAVERSRMAEAEQILGDIATAQSIRYMQSGEWLTSASDGDITIPAGSASNFTITIGVDNNSKGTGVAQAKRKGGMYGGSILQISVDKYGAIQKACKDGGQAGFCALAGTAGYPASSNISDIAPAETPGT